MTDTESTPVEIAKAVGVSTNGRPVREAIKAARHALASAAETYVELHMLATEVAALKGDASPAQWALERIAEGADRVVDAPKSGPSMPSVQIGIALGGSIAPKANQPAFTIQDVPTLIAEVEEP